MIREEFSFRYLRSTFVLSVYFLSWSRNIHNEAIFSLMKVTLSTDWKRPGAINRVARSHSLPLPEAHQDSCEDRLPGAAMPTQLSHPRTLPLQDPQASKEMKGIISSCLPDTEQPCAEKQPAPKECIFPQTPSVTAQGRHSVDISSLARSMPRTTSQVGLSFFFFFLFLPLSTTWRYSEFLLIRPHPLPATRTKPLSHFLENCTACRKAKFRNHTREH